MLSRQQMVAGFMVVAAILAAFFWRVEQRSQPVEASTLAQDTATRRTVSVSGYGTVQARPDVATINLAVKTTDESVVKAVDDNGTTIALVIDAVRKVGVDSSDIETNFFWVSQDFKTKGATSEDKPIPIYGVTNSITVTVRDIDKVSAVISAAVDAGANQVSSPNFFVSDTTSYVNQARDLALADAHDRAETLAVAYGMTVGDPLYLSDTAYRSGGGGGGGGGGAVIIPGTESISFSVGVTFELK